MAKQLNFKVGDVVRVIKEGDFKNSEGIVKRIYAENVLLDLYKYPMYMGENKDGSRYLVGWHDWSKCSTVPMPNYISMDDISRYKHEDIEVIVSVASVEEES